MKIAVSSIGSGLDDQLDPRFGRCAYFVIVDTDDMSLESFDNESKAMGGGAGIQSAQFVASKGAGAVITGNCGPNAVRTLLAAGVEVVVGQTGTVKEVVDNYKAGVLKSIKEANVPGHHGMMVGNPKDQGAQNSPGSGMGRGRQGGRGSRGGGRRS